MSLYRRFLPYGMALVSTTLALGLSLWLEAIIFRTIGALFYIAIAFTTWYGGFRPGIVAITLSAGAIDYYFLPPKYQFSIGSIELFQLLLFVLVSLIITLLSVNLKQSRHRVEQLSQQLIDESSDRLKTALNAAQMGLWDWNLVTGEITWSPEHEQLMGIAPDTFDGRYETFDQRLHPDDREALTQALTFALQNKVPYRHEFRVIWPDQSVHWVEGRGRALYNEAGKPIRMTGTAMAIDQRKQAETALQEQESLLQLFARYAPAGIAMFNRDMRYLLVSQRWVDEYQLGSVDSVLGRSHYDIFPEIPDHWRETHQRCLAGAIEQCDEDWLVRTDGTSQCISWEVRPWYTAAATIGGIIIFTVDVTQQKQNEQSLQALNQELEQRVAERTLELQHLNDLLSNFFNAASLANIGLCIHDPNLRFVQINEALAAINGHSVVTHLGKTPSELLPELAPIVNPLIQQVLTTGQPIMNLEIMAAMPSQSGVARYWLASYFPILQQNDPPETTGVGVMVFDITERQQVKQIKDEFIGIVSHELRTPLTAIQMSLGLLNMGIYANKPEKAQRMIEIALTDTKRLVNLVNDILDLERLEAGRTALEKTVCSAMELMQMAVQGMQAIATQHHVTLTLTPTTATVWAAPDTIVQTLTNLLSNAIKFSLPDSVVWLRAEVQAFEQLGPEPNTSPCVLFSVADQGRGIPEDKLETIFGRFQQVDASDSREKGGTGLGLSICRSIIERHNGKIWAESTPGKGSTFFFTLPLPPEQPL